MTILRIVCLFYIFATLLTRVQEILVAVILKNDAYRAPQVYIPTLRQRSSHPIIGTPNDKRIIYRIRNEYKK